jgi:polyisoprenoid-binding protein YceI
MVDSSVWWTSRAFHTVARKVEANRLLTSLLMTNPQPPVRPPLWRRRWFLATTGVFVLVAVGLGVGIWWYLRDDAPDEVSLDAAVEAAGGGASEGAHDDGAVAEPPDGAVTDGESAGGGDDTTGGGDDTTGYGDDGGTPEGGADGVTGTWSVDLGLGEFAFEEATGSFAGFRVEEELAGIGSTTAVGRTPEVEGSIEIDGTTLVSAEIVADMTAIVTDDSRRDGAVQRTLDTGEFPTATFVLSESVELGAGAATGSPVAVEAPGTLTIHGVSREVLIPIEAQLVNGDRIALVGSIPVVFADYDVDTPTAAIVVSLQDDGIMEFQLLMTRS